MIGLALMPPARLAGVQIHRHSANRVFRRFDCSQVVYIAVMVAVIMILELVHRVVQFFGCVDFEVQRLRGAEIALGRRPFHGEAALSFRQQAPALLELLLIDLAAGETLLKDIERPPD